MNLSLSPPPGGGPGTQGPVKRRTVMTPASEAKLGGGPKKGEERLHVDPAYLHNLHQQARAHEHTTISARSR